MEMMEEHRIPYVDSLPIYWVPQKLLGDRIRKYVDLSLVHYTQQEHMITESTIYDSKKIQVKKLQNHQQK